MPEEKPRIYGLVRKPKEKPLPIFSKTGTREEIKKYCLDNQLDLSDYLLFELKGDQNGN